MKKTVFLQNSFLKLQYFNYAESTIRIYIYYISEFLDEIKKNPAKLNSEDFKNYLLNYGFSSVSQQNQVISSLSFFYMIERKTHRSFCLWDVSDKINLDLKCIDE